MLKESVPIPARPYFSANGGMLIEKSDASVNRKNGGCAEAQSGQETPRISEGLRDC